MDLTSATRQITRTVSDGTGLSQEEVGLLVTATAAVAAVLAILRTGAALMDVWPTHKGRTRGRRT